jgi:hypothetical protein
MVLHCYRATSGLDRFENKIERSGSWKKEMKEREIWSDSKWLESFHFMIQMCCGQVTWFLFAIKTGNGHPLFDIHWWEITCRIYPWIRFFNHNPMNHPYYCEYECPFYMGINIGIEFNIWHYMTTYGCLPKMLNPWPYMAIDRPRSEVHPEAEDLALETAPGPGPPPRFTALKASRIAVICFFGVNINKPRWIKSSICRVLET